MVDYSRSANDAPIKFSRSMLSIGRPFIETFAYNKAPAINYQLNSEIETVFDIEMRKRELESRKEMAMLLLGQEHDRGNKILLR